MFFYIARSRVNEVARKYHIYKAGCSMNPQARIRNLGGAISTDTFEPLLIIKLPLHVRDTHILAHRLVHPFVVSQHEKLTRKYLSLFGAKHLAGIRRRRELLLFGTRYTLKHIKQLFAKVVRDMTSRHGVYKCREHTCGGQNPLCGVCVKYTATLLNKRLYRQRPRLRLLTQL